MLSGHSTRGPHTSSSLSTAWLEERERRYKRNRHCDGLFLTDAFFFAQQRGSVYVSWWHSDWSHGTGALQHRQMARHDQVLVVLRVWEFLPNAPIVDSST